MGQFVSLMLLFACSNGSQGPAAAVARDSGQSATVIELNVVSGELLTEAVMACDSVDSIDAHRFLCRDADGVWYVDEADDQPSFLGVYDAMAAAMMDESILMALDGKTVLFDGTEMVPITIPTPVPIETMEPVGDSLWLMGAGRLFRYRDGRVTELSVEGHPTIFDVAVASDRVHIAVPEVITLDASGDRPVVIGQTDTAADSMAVDASGHLWFIADTRLFVQRRDEVPVEVAMPEPVHTVVGPTIWIEGETEAYRYQGGGLMGYPLVAGGMVGVDEYGRMLQVREGSVRRHSGDRPVVVVGLPESVTVATTVRLLPSDPGSVDTLRVWVDAAEVPVTGPPYAITIDPEMLDAGEHTLRFFTQSARGEALSERGVWVGELADVTWDGVAGISEEHCIHCHGGQTLTDLSGPSEWQNHIDSIIEVVTMQDMPLGGPYLTEDEITMIRAWKHGGFQP